MNFQFYLEKLYSSPEFEKFKNENPKAYPCSAFFVIDLENKKLPDNRQHFDFCIPGQNKIFSFMLEKICEMVPIDNADGRELTPIKVNYTFNMKDVEKLIVDEMVKRDITNHVQKILLSLQNIKGKDYFVGTVFISALGMVKIKIDIDGMKFLDFEKKSFLDVINVFKKDKK